MHEDGDLEVVVEPCADSAVVRVAGELDISTRPALASVLENLLERQCPDIVIDVRDLRFADASAMSLFVSSTRRARTVGGRLRIRNVTPLLARVFTITRVGTVLEIEGSS